MKQKCYIAIDLKSFYASVECVERGLDPMAVNLVVADASRTEKTICLAVSPSLKAYGIPGRARLFEVVERVAAINAERRKAAPNGVFLDKSWNAPSLQKNPYLELDYIVAKPQMAHYMEASAGIYQIYLKYIAPEDIHVYSVDEVFIDATPYLKVYGMSDREFASVLIRDIMQTTGITATAGIGTNLYLCKVAMDIVAKHCDPDENGARIAQLDELSYRKLLWDHRPLTDFWRVGRGYQAKLEKNGMFTMGDIARCSLGKSCDFHNEKLLYKLFGVNAELLIDHAWGYEPCTIADIKNYKPSSNSISSGQVLSEPYSWNKAKLIVREMTELLSLDLVEKGLITPQIGLSIGYDIENLTNNEIQNQYHGDIAMDHYGRRVPKAAHSTINLPEKTSSSRLILQAMMDLFDQIANPKLLVRRITVCANSLTREESSDSEYQQFDLFSDVNERKNHDALLQRERQQQMAVLEIKRRFGKNAILRGMNLEEGATARDRNKQIGGHKA